MKFANAIYLNFVALGYLARSKLTTGRKVRVIVTLFKLTFKYFIVDKLRKIKKENILGFRVRAFDYHAILFLYREIFVKSEYYFEPTTPEPVIFDCGANLGMATLYWKWLYPNAKIHAFEPDPQTFGLLEQNVAANDLANVTLHNVALSDKDELVSFSIDPARPGLFIMSTVAGRLNESQISVQAKQLSPFINERIDFLKMDIEGSEQAVMQEIEPKLYQIGEMVIEYHHNVGGNRSNLSSFTGLLERNELDYQLDARCTPFYTRKKFQDVLIYCYPAARTDPSIAKEACGSKENRQ